MDSVGRDFMGSVLAEVWDMRVEGMDRRIQICMGLHFLVVQVPASIGIPLLFTYPPPSAVLPIAEPRLLYSLPPPPQDTPSFCSQVLCSPDLVTYINDHFVCWGGDVQQPDAFQV